MEDTFGEHPLPASRTAMAKGIITALMAINIVMSWYIFGAGDEWSPPSASGWMLIGIFALVLGWLHARPGMTGTRPAIVIAWITTVVTLLTLLLALAMSGGGSAPPSYSRDFVVMLPFFVLSCWQLLIPISARWAQNANETFWSATKREMKIVVIGVVVFVAFLAYYS